MRNNRFSKTVMMVLVFAMAFASFPVISFAEENKGKILADEVNLRKEPNTESEVIKQLKIDSSVNILGVEGDWYHCSQSGDEGYVRMDYVFYSDDIAKATINADDVKFRAGPSVEDEVYGHFDTGNHVEIIGLKNGWYKVKYGGKVGYVSVEYVDVEINGGSEEEGLLKVGSKGDEVTKLQKELKKLGYFNHSVTGEYGAITRAAVEKAQKKAKLHIDGIAGAETIAVIENGKLPEADPEVKINGKVELLSWFDGGKEWFAKGKTVTVTDVKTGKQFKAKRFGGWFHADSEPVSKDDTAIMKQIYGGKWSWDRRAIWISMGGKTVAASMHGMPHMVDAVPGNDFPGHFCIHLYKSKVHANSKECPRHQAAVMKAFNTKPKD